MNICNSQITECLEVKGIGNYYGGIEICVYQGKYYWGMQDYNATDWEEIDEEFYLTLKART